MDAWRAQPTPEALKFALDRVQERVGEMRERHQVLYDEAHGVWAKSTLADLRQAIDWLQWARRLVLDEAAEKGSLTRRAAAEATGLDTSVIQRWSKSPLRANPDGSFGPAGHEREIR